MNRRSIIYGTLILSIASGIFGYIEYKKNSHFRFKDFSTSRSLFDYLATYYPKNSNASILLHDLKKAGASCKLLDQKENKKYQYEKYRGDIIHYCLYDTGWNSFTPYIHYIIHLVHSQNNEIIDIHVKRRDAIRG